MPTKIEKARKLIARAQRELRHDPGKLIAHAIATDIFDRAGLKRAFEEVEKETMDDMLEDWSVIANMVIQEKVLGGPPL